MIIFSIVITCYNGIKYIDRCLTSILEQTYKNFEVIFIDDGSVDNSFYKVKKYQDKRIKAYKITNHGISYARNYAIEKTMGTHLLFIDIDDWINPDLLENLKNNIGNNDLIRFQAVMKDDNNQEYEKFITSVFSSKSGVDALYMFCKNKEIFSPSWLYCYDLKFWKSNNFKYPIAKLQEDFALMTIILLKASTVSSIPYIGYNYYRSENSIMRNNDEDYELHKANDVMEHCDNLFNLINNLNDKELSKIFLEYIKWVLSQKASKLTYINKSNFEHNTERTEAKWEKLLLKNL